MLAVSQQILPDGKLGCFDEHGIFPFSPVQLGDEIHAYTSGITRRVSVSVDSGIGLAISKDGGTSFKRFGDGPVLTSSLYEPFLVIDGQVRVYNDQFHMWYIYGTNWTVFDESNEPDRTYVIGHAVSENGIDWVRENRSIITSVIEYESQALPSVIKIGDRYIMAFCYRHSSDFRNNPQRSYTIGFAESNDLVNWERNDMLFGGITRGNQGEWDSDMLCYPNLFELDGNVYLLYNGNTFGRYGFGLARLVDD